ncbi:MAG: ABC transporter permease [Planctomycetes bacterium]|jgi:ribose transport system permease protein|nr:ABC transporter permease [Planctomycetota bacterium]
MNTNEPAQSVDATAAVALPRRKPSVRLYLTRETVLIGLTLVAIVGASLAFPTSFPTFRNFSALLRNMAMDGVMACGMVILLVSGMFDLSVGSMFSMAGVLTGWLLTQGHLPAPLAILAGLCLAAAGGALNGWIVARVRVNALITTLGTMQIFRGIAVLVGGPGIANLPPAFARWGQAQWLGLQAPIWLMLAVAIVGQFLMARSRFFRRYYYIGANAKAATLSGIPVERMLILAFTLMGLLAGLAGIAFASRMATANSTAGDGAELRIITAVILGGASLQGGRGTVWGTLVGVFFISLINNVMIFARLKPEWQSIVIGMVLVLAVAMDRFLSRRV